MFSNDISHYLLKFNLPHGDHLRTLQAACFETKLGPMIAIAGAEALYLLEFVDRRKLDREVHRLMQQLKATAIPGESDILKNIKSEMDHYFNGKLTQFETPIYLSGSVFQKKVWGELRNIPHGETRSYLELAKALQKPTAYRAVAQANSTNQLAIIVPCHRVINANGELGGYAGGVAKKQWLLAHEKNNASAD